ncbi:MAG: nicotinate phosphoribosyltransferase, partial [Candidatus Altiarchaeales archaeon ex4484_96]
MKEGNRLFYTANEDEIKRGDTTDVYLARTRDILKACETDKEVVAEISCGSLPDNWDYGVFAGVEQALNLLEGYPVDVECLPEGTVFEPRDYGGVRIPLLNIKGRYSDFCMLETPLLGLLCQATGIATAASRIKTLAGDKKVLSFGVRRMHPAIAPMIDR